MNTCTLHKLSDPLFFFFFFKLTVKKNLRFVQPSPTHAYHLIDCSPKRLHWRGVIKKKEDFWLSMKTEQSCGNEAPP